MFICGLVPKERRLGDFSGNRFACRGACEYTTSELGMWLSNWPAEPLGLDNPFGLISEVDLAPTLGVLRVLT